MKRKGHQLKSLQEADKCHRKGERGSLTHTHTHNALSGRLNPKPKPHLFRRSCFPTPTHNQPAFHFLSKQRPGPLAPRLALAPPPCQFQIAFSSEIDHRVGRSTVRCSLNLKAPQPFSTLAASSAAKQTTHSITTHTQHRSDRITSKTHPNPTRNSQSFSVPFSFSNSHHIASPCFLARNPAPLWPRHSSSATPFRLFYIRNLAAHSMG